MLLLSVVFLAGRLLALLKRGGELRMAGTSSRIGARNGCATPAGGRA